MLTPEKLTKLSVAELQHLQNARVIQNTLVYVINLPQVLADPELLQSPLYFGQYGNIAKFVQNKPSASGFVGVYITYAREEEAALCIKACHGFELMGHRLTATYGTTKYCSFFLSGKQCPKPNCMFLHKLAPQRNTLAREGLPLNKHIQPEDALIDKLKIELVPRPGMPGLPSARVVRERTASACVSASHSPQRQRFYSKDLGRSRYGFLEESEEEPLAVPDYCAELSSQARPSWDSAEVSSLQLEEIMSPASPDRWAVDVLEVRPRGFSEAASLHSEEDTLLVLRKQSGTT